MISTTSLGAAAVATYGFPYYHVHRADLMDALVAHAREQPNLHLHPGFAFRRVRADRTGRRDPDRRHNDQQRYTGALLVGADGIHSVTRSRLFGEQAPQFTGNVAWRALVPVERSAERAS